LASGPEGRWPERASGPEGKGRQGGIFKALKYYGNWNIGKLEEWNNDDNR